MAQQEFIVKRQAVLDATALEALLRQIELRARRVLSGMQVGDFSTATKGSGFEFNQLRDYQEGDDVRFIDWKSSARSNKLLVRQYLEERNRSVMLLVDGSASLWCGSTGYLKADVVATIASLLASVANYGKDAVGLIIFTDTAELTIAPARGRAHVQQIIRQLYEYEPQSKKSSLSSALDYVAKQHYKDMFVFMISDFIDDGFDHALAGVAHRHELYAIRCLDRCEKEGVPAGLMTLYDAETMQEVEVLASAGVHSAAIKKLHERIEAQDRIFRKCGVACLEVSTDRFNVGDIISFFRHSVRY